MAIPSNAAEPRNAKSNKSGDGWEHYPAGTRICPDWMHITRGKLKVCRAWEDMPSRDPERRRAYRRQYKARKRAEREAKDEM